jgi:hypothetical protein
MPYDNPIINNKGKKEGSLETLTTRFPFSSSDTAKTFASGGISQ